MVVTLLGVLAIMLVVENRVEDHFDAQISQEFDSIRKEVDTRLERDPERHAVPDAGADGRTDDHAGADRAAADAVRDRVTDGKPDGDGDDLFQGDADADDHHRAALAARAVDLLLVVLEHPPGAELRRRWS